MDKEHENISDLQKKVKTQFFLANLNLIAITSNFDFSNLSSFYLCDSSKKF